ncbi:MAG TPA: 4-(cytidine 5'-diphospho)-2-C-methyl-D-erythritol kinase, partial [Acidobacteriaceae bacterium]|nr:4-(cytidine 5'-diphospho)-2-C-methyl-D-erythritol kinase [Acidobacteriaceae bacterium]
MPTRVRSFSKINLGLAVGPARADGFHALVTAYQTLALRDVVTVSAVRAAQTQIRVMANHPGVPRSALGNAERNTAWKMVAGALDRLGLTASVEIDIEKSLPVQGGLGAGSANAAAALIGLERELGLTIAPPQRLALAAEVGSDVPLFLLGGTVLGLGRGEEVYPLPDLPSTPCVVAVPGVGVSTAAAFCDLDARMSSASANSGTPLTSGPFADRLRELSCALAAVWTATGADLGRPSGSQSASEPGPTGIASTIRPDRVSTRHSGDSPTGGAPASQEDTRSDLAENPFLALVRTGIENDFEEVVFQQHPSLRSTKRDLMGSDSSQALY